MQLKFAFDNSTPTHSSKNNIVDMDGNEFCGHDTVLNDNTNIVNDKLFSYSISDMDCTSSDLSFFESADNKAVNDFLYYGWPEVGNFEDVDRMLRSCDSPFGLGVSKDDDLGWLSSADDLGLGGYGDVVESDVKFPFPDPNFVGNISENHASKKGCSINDSATTTAPIRSKNSSWTSEEAFVIGPDTVNNKYGFTTHEQINDHKRYVKLQNQSKGEGKGYSFRNGSFTCGEVLQSDIIHPPGLSYHPAFPHVRMQHPKSYNYLANPVSNEHSDNSHLSDVNLKPSSAKSDNDDLTSNMPRDTFSTRSQNMESSADNSLFEVSVLALSGQREKLQSFQGSQSSVHSSMKNRTVAIFDPGSERCNYGDPEGVRSATPAELSSLTLQESLAMSSGSDNLSMEAASFHQLQLVMEQLDLQTKLCIRDGLYRLARNAKKRHYHANLNIECGDGRESIEGASMTEETKTFADRETGTNPIDRSIAHLLFHQLSDSSPTTPAHNPFLATLHRSAASEQTVSET